MKKTIGAGALLVSLLIVLLTALPAAAISEHPLPASSFFAPSFTDDNKMTTQSQDDYPSPTSDFFVNDFASCLTDEDKSTIQALGEELYKKTKAQVVVVTVQSLGGRDIESYSIGLAREWGIGDKDDDSGVLLLLSTGDRQVRIEVGKGLEGSLTDGKSGRILDSYAVPYLKNSDYSTGLRECYKKLVEEVYSEYGVEGYTSIDDTDIGDYSSSGFGDEKIDLAVIIIITVLVLITLILPGPHNSQSNLSRRRRSSRRRLSRRRILRRRLRRAFIRRVLGRLVLGRIFGRRRRLLRRRKLTRILIFHT